MHSFAVSSFPLGITANHAVPSARENFRPAFVLVFLHTSASSAAITHDYQMSTCFKLGLNSLALPAFLDVLGCF